MWIGWHVFLRTVILYRSFSRVYSHIALTCFRPQYAFNLTLDVNNHPSIINLLTIQTSDHMIILHVSNLSRLNLILINMDTWLYFTKCLYRYKRTNLYNFISNVYSLMKTTLELLHWNIYKRSKKSFCCKLCVDIQIVDIPICIQRYFTLK